MDKDRLRLKKKDSKNGRQFKINDYEVGSD